MTVSLMASSAAMTASGKSSRSPSSRSPASLRAMVSGANTVCSTGTSSLLPSRMSLNASSSLPSAPCPGSSGLSFAQRRQDLHGARRPAGLGAVGRSAVRDPAPPVLDAVDTARHDLDQIEVPRALEREHGLCETARGVVDLGHMAPERHGRPIHGPAGERSQDALSLGHGLSVYHFCRGELSARAMV